MRRIILLGCAVVLVVTLVAAGAAYWFLSGDGIRLALEHQASAWLGQPVRISSATGQVFPRIGVQLRDVRIGEAAQITLSDVELSASLGALFSRRIEDADVIISESQIGLPLPIGSQPPKGDSTAETPAVADAPPPVELVSVRTISLRDVTIRSRGREIVVSADGTLAGSELQLTRFDAESGQTRLSASGTVTLGPRLEARFDASANRLDLDELFALAAAFLPDEASGGKKSGGATSHVVAHLTADTVSAASVHASKLSADMTLDGERVTLQPLTFELFGGTYEGALQARLGESLDMRLTSKIVGLDVAQLATFGGVPDTITGRLSGNGTFVGRGPDFDALLTSARGDASASIVDGTINRLNLIRTVVLFFGRPDPDAAPGADAFDRLDAQFSLAQRVVNASQFLLRSPDADIDGQGTLSLVSKALAGTAELRLSEALSKQAGTDLVRFAREGNRVLLPARISGTLEEPRITIDAAAAARRGIRNEVGRRLQELFNR